MCSASILLETVSIPAQQRRQSVPAETRHPTGSEQAQKAAKHCHRSKVPEAVSKHRETAVRIDENRTDHAACRLACTSSAASAAGVTPATRPAAASVAGRAVVSLSTISRERPGIAS